MIQHLPVNRRFLQYRSKIAIYIQYIVKTYITIFVVTHFGMPIKLFDFGRHLKSENSVFSWFWSACNNSVRIIGSRMVENNKNLLLLTENIFLTSGIFASWRDNFTF
jgi:hypothetical protein